MTAAPQACKAPPPKAAAPAAAAHGILQRKCACGGGAGLDDECESCRGKHLSRKAGGGASSPPPAVPGIVGETLRSPGRPLDPATRTLMETRFGHHFGRISLRPAAPAAMPSRLTMDTPGDAFEREADRVADATHRRAAAPQASGANDSPAPAAGPEPSPAGFDFGRVRIHTDARAATSARAVDALAYTVGPNVVFGAGQYAPHTDAGRRLLAHELAHVVQQTGGQPTPALQRTRCGHDGKETACGAGGTGVWKLVDQITNEATLFQLDDIIVEQGLKQFGGTWLRQVQSPPNLMKSAKASRGRIDGVKIAEGPTLDVEVVEVKARSDGGGGCERATSEAKGYVAELALLAPLLVPLSAKLAAVGGLKVEGGKCKTPKAADRKTLQAAGVDFDNPSSVNAWCFYNSLQDRLGRAFVKPFAAVNIRLNSDGKPNHPYTVLPPVVINCRKTKANPSGLGLRFLGFQVNQEGGVSYGCHDQCQPRDEKEKQKSLVAGKDASDEAAKMDQAFENIDKYNRLDLPSPNPQPGASAGSKEGDKSAATPDPDALTPTEDPSDPGDHADQVQLPPEGVSEWDAFLATGTVIATVAVLHQSIKYAATAAEKKLARELIEKTIEKGMERGAIEIAKKLDSANLVKYGTKEGDLLLKGADEALVVAAKASPRLAARLGPTALKSLSKAAPIIGLVLAANDARAAISHVSKGGSIELGPSLDSKELKGDTQIKNKGAGGADLPGDVSLNDTVIDVETKTAPHFEGKADIEADKVTISGAQADDGGSVTMNMKVKISNSTITFKNNGVIQNGKVLAGDADIKDSQIEIDLPPGALDPGRKTGEKTTIAGAKIKVTSLSGGGGTSGGGPAGAGKGSGATPVPTGAPPATVAGSTPSGTGTTTPPVDTAAPPVAGPDRPKLISEIQADPVLLQLYQSMAGKDGVVPTDELLRRFAALAPLVRRHPSAVPVIIANIRSGPITDQIKQIIEPIENILQQENVKLGEKLAQSVGKPTGTSGTPTTGMPTGKRPATTATSGGGNKPSDGTPTTGTQKPAPDAKTSDNGQPGEATDATKTPDAKDATKTPDPNAPPASAKAAAIKFGDIVDAVSWDMPIGPDEKLTPPARYTHVVTWTPTVDGKTLSFQIPLDLVFESNVPAEANLWAAKYRFKAPGGVVTTDQGDVPVRFSDAGAAEFTKTIVRRKPPAPPKLNK